MSRLEHATSLCTPRRPSEVALGSQTGKVERSQAYQHIELAELAPDEISQASSAGGLRNVQLVEHDVRQAEAAKPVDRLGAPRLVPRGQDDGEPAGRQLPAYLEPHAPVPAGDQGHPDVHKKINHRRGKDAELKLLPIYQ